MSLLFVNFIQILLSFIGSWSFSWVLRLRENSNWNPKWYPLEPTRIAERKDDARLDIFLNAGNKGVIRL